MIELKEDYNKTINKLRQFVRSWGKADVYLVGGCVRDELLGLVPKDIDLVIDYPNGSEEFTNFLRATYQLDVCRGFTVFPKYGTSRFSVCIGPDKWIPIECVIPRTEKYEGTTRKPSSVEFGSLSEDAERRDFCCNALYKNVMSDDIIDPTGKGLDDLKAMILRTPIDSEQTFLDDPLRMLRAIRFSVCKGFTIDPETYSKIKPYKSYYDLSKERIQDELNKIILSPKPIEGIKMLQDRGLLRHILPTLSLYWGMDQNSKYHSLDLTEHTFKVLEGVMIDKYSESGPRPRELQLRLAAIFHDLGKPESKVSNANGTCSYYCHEKKSAEVVERELVRLKYSRDIIDTVKKLVENHMCIKGNYSYDTQEYTGSPKLTRKVARQLGNELSLEMTLIEADNMAHAPQYCMPGQVKSFFEHYKNDVLLFKDKTKKGQPVSGNTIMEKFGVTGKAVGDIKRLFDAWYISDPNLSEDDLVKKYIDWTDGIEIWVSRELSGDQAYIVSYSEPTVEKYIVSLPFGSVSVRYAENILIKEFPKLKPGEKIKVSAYQYPGLHLALENKEKVEKIIDEAGEKLGGLLWLDGFLEVDMNYNCHNDLVSQIKWSDGRIDTFM